MWKPLSTALQGNIPWIRRHARIRLRIRFWSSQTTNNHAASSIAYNSPSLSSRAVGKTPVLRTRFAN